jgi:methionyl-tRNA formyltransferase
MQAARGSFNFILLGTGGRFTTVVLESLLAAGHVPDAYLNWGRFSAADSLKSLAGIEIESPNFTPEIARLCETHRVAITQDAHKNLARIVAALEVDFLCSACWPELIGDEVIESVSGAAMNLHPSLLPAYRGIDPIRAQLQAGETDLGVSLHLLSPQFDSGDLIAQSRLPTDSEPDYASIETGAAKIGAGLLIQAMANYGTEAWRPRPQS